MKWVVDMEAYQLGGSWYPKEIALLNADTGECTCLTIYVDVHYNIINPIYYPTIGYQFRRHRLRWNEGEYHIATVKAKFQSMVNLEDEVYCKGEEKVQYFKSWFKNVFEVHAPSFKVLKKYPDKYCERQHGFICAKRKCFELLEYI